jgi:hypothetical protein
LSPQRQASPCTETILSVPSSNRGRGRQKQPWRQPGDGLMTVLEISTPHPPDQPEGMHNTILPDGRFAAPLAQSAATSTRQDRSPRL